MIASAGPDEYRRAIEVALTAPETDALIVIYTPVDPTHRRRRRSQAIRDGIAAARARRRDAQAGARLPDGRSADGRCRSTSAASACRPTRFPENAARALAKVADLRGVARAAAGPALELRRHPRRRGARVCRRAIAARGDGWLTGDETRRVLGAFGAAAGGGHARRIRPTRRRRSRAVLGFPVVAKLASRRVQHKTEIGGVRLESAERAAVRARVQRDHDARAAGRRRSTTIDGVLIQAMIAGGVETMIGVADDPLFGPLVGVRPRRHSRRSARRRRLPHRAAHRSRRRRTAPRDSRLPAAGGLPRPPAGRPRRAARTAAAGLPARRRRAGDRRARSQSGDRASPGHGCRIVDARIKVRANPESRTHS